MRVLDLTHGQPLIYHPYWKGIGHTSGLYVEAGEGVAYPGVLPYDSLIRAIRDLHDRVGNTDARNCDIVVGYGATQMLRAALYAFKKVYNCKWAYAPAPYYLNMPHMAEKEGLSWTSVPLDNPGQNAVEIVTSPNNPDGKLRGRTLMTPHVIWDSCYNWPQYTPIVPNKTDTFKAIEIYGLSKGFGLAGTRIGWALVKDRKLLDAMRHTVYHDSLGISFEAQTHAELAIQYQLTEVSPPVLQFAAQELWKRWTTVTQTLKTSRLGFVAESHSGMFLWLRSSKNLNAQLELELIGVKAYPGLSFGADPSYARVNIACTEEDFQEFIRRLKA